MNFKQIANYKFHNLMQNNFKGLDKEQVGNHCYGLGNEYQFLTKFLGYVTGTFITSLKDLKETCSVKYLNHGLDSYGKPNWKRMTQFGAYTYIHVSDLCQEKITKPQDMVVARKTGQSATSLGNWLNVRLLNDGDLKWIQPLLFQYLDKHLAQYTDEWKRWPKIKLIRYHVIKPMTTIQKHLAFLLIGQGVDAINNVSMSIGQFISGRINAPIKNNFLIVDHLNDLISSLSGNMNNLIGEVNNDDGMTFPQTSKTMQQGIKKAQRFDGTDHFINN